MGIVWWILLILSLLVNQVQDSNDQIAVDKYENIVYYIWK